MTRDGFIGQLEDYLTDFDGETPLPDRVRDGVHAALPRTRQARPRPGPLKEIPMLSHASTGTRWGLVAAMLVVAALGAALLTNAGIAGPSTPTPTPIPSPTLPPTPAASLLAIGSKPSDTCEDTGTDSADCVQPGTYTLDPNLPRSMTVTVPRGWFEWDQGMGSVGLLTGQGPAQVGSGWGVMMLLVGAVPRDPCDPGLGTLPATDVDTPEKLAAAMAAWPSFESTQPAPITIDGRHGVSIQLVSATNPAGCLAGWTFRTPTGSVIDTYPMVNDRAVRYPTTFRIVDADGTLFVIRTPGTTQTSPFEESQGLPRDPNQHVTDQAELDAIVGSIRLGDPVPAPSS